MTYELYPLRASKVNVDDNNTELRLTDKDGEEIIIILPSPTYGLFYHNQNYKLVIEHIPDEPQRGL